MKRERRSYEEIESAVVNSLKNFGKKGASINKISFEAKTNWKTTKTILERFKKWEIVEIIGEDKKLKIYRWRY